MRLIVDAHLDLAWNALTWKRDITRPIAEVNAAESSLTDHPSRGRATTSLPEMRRGGVGLCLATLLVRAPTQAGPVFLPGDLDFRTSDMAYAIARGQIAYYSRLVERGELLVVGDRNDLDRHCDRWRNARGDTEGLPVGAIIAMEGSDGIVSPEQVPHWRELGLRVASLVHYGRNAYAGGTGDDTPLSAAGRELLQAFEREGIILDVTHLCDRSFDGALDAYGGPLLASHSNCRALVPHDRQFTDGQIRRLLERGAVIGLAFDAWMLYPGWMRGKTSREVVSIEAVADHLDHIVSLAGDVTQVAIGSDLDGGYGTEQTPVGLDTIADLAKLEDIFAKRGYSSEAIDAVFHGNWIRFFLEHLPETSSSER